MPPMPPMPPDGSPAEFLSGLSTMTTAVVRKSAAIDAAFCSADRATLAGVDDPGRDQVDVLTGRGVEPPAGLQPTDLLGDDAALEAGVDRDLLERGLQRGRCCVAEGRAGSTPRRPGSDCECEFGEDRLEPSAGLSIVSEFVVAAA